MRLLGLIVVFLFALSSPAETLRQILGTNGIPENTFSNSELDGEVNAATAIRRDRVLVVYMRLDKDNAFTGNPQLIQFNRDSGTIVRSEVKPEDDGLCCGSPEDLAFVDDFAVVSFHINPSAETTLVLGKDLRLVTTLYGFDVRAVAPGQLLFIENMVHFAPVHPERLQLADLRSGKRMELYPPKGDPLRAEFAREHAKHMPPQAACGKMNDPCNPDLYDEDVDFIDVDGQGTFTFKVERTAAHAMTSEQPETVASAAALYRYTWNGSNWMYCEENLLQDQMSRQRREGDASPKVGCTPALPVVPDMSNADFSPFDEHRHN